MKTYKEFINEKYIKAAKAAAKVFSNLSKYSKVKPLSGIKPKTTGQLYQGMKVKPIQIPKQTNILTPKKPIRFDTGGSLSSKPKIDKTTGERISLKGYKNLYPSKIKKVKGATFGDKVLYSKQGKPFDKAIKQERLPMPKPLGKAKNVVGQKGVKETIPTTPKTKKLDPFPKISNPNRKPFTPSTLSKSKQEIKKLTDPQKRSKMLKAYQRNTFNARQGKMDQIVNRPSNMFYSPSKKDIRKNPLAKKGTVYDKFAKLQKETKPYNPAKDQYQVSKAASSGKNPVQKKVALDKLSTQYRSRHTFRKGNPKFSRDVKSLNRQIDICLLYTSPSPRDH